MRCCGPSFGCSSHAIGWAMCLIGLTMVLPVGMLMLGVATLRAKVLTSWGRPLPLLIGLILSSLFPIKLVMVFWFPELSDDGLLSTVGVTIAVGWLAMGYALWRDDAGAPAAR